jgi:hypothetical protein
MNQAADPFEMIRNFWANVPGMGGGMGAAQMPSFDPKDLEKRLAELKQVKQWLEMNMNMLSLQINTMEMQLAAFNGFKSGMGEEPEANADMAETAGAAAGAASNAGAQAFAQGAQALQSMPWANPGEWIKSMQAMFEQPPAQRASKKAGANKAAAKSAPAKSAPAKATAAKRARSRS